MDKKNGISPLNALRKRMEKENIALFICNNSDPYMSEYPAAHWKVRQWLSGFTGSNGLLMVESEKAALWSDSRYVLQAAFELDEEILFFNESLPASLTPFRWIESLQLPTGSRIALDGRCFSVHYADKWRDFCCQRNYSLELSWHPADELWVERPPIEFNTVYLLPGEYTGASVSEKLASVRRQLREKQSDLLLVTTLDEVAWLFNLRGTDMACSPLAYGCAYVEAEGDTFLFIETSKATSELLEYLHNEGVVMANFDKWEERLALIGTHYSVWIDPAKCNAYYSSLLRTENRVYEPSPVESLKSIKNPVEIEGESKVMVYDGVALCRLFRWVEKMLGERNPLRETDIAAKIAEIRSEHPAYLCESFDAIVAYGANGAIVHYFPQKGKDAEPETNSLLLVDTGTHYKHGTTDITRTIALGVPTAEMRRNFTLVLKGHIALATAIFPEGTRGTQLDVLARQFLWKEGTGYLHGTGHGIGYALNVHEGPQGIRMQENPTTLQPGMLLSNEPGYYKEGHYGIRCENILLVKEHNTTDFARFFCFETLSLYPFDHKLIDKQLLTSAETEWINSYHQQVYEKLSPLLKPEEREWLLAKVKPL